MRVIAASVVAAVVSAVPLASGTAAPPPPNRLVVDWRFDWDWIDPAVSFFTYTWQAEYATCLKLVNYPDLPVPAGTLLQPDAAEMPTVSADGTTYTFRIRGGHAFNTGEPVTAATFEHSLERARSVSTFARDFLKDVADIRSAGDALVIALTQPSGDFLARLSMPFFCAVPLSAPPAIVTEPLPSAGPYYIASRDAASGETLLRRNPNYGGSRPRRFEEILIKAGLAEAQIRSRVEGGESDYGSALPVDAHAGLATLYGSGSPAAAAGRQRYFVNPTSTFRYLTLNNERPLFADARLRKAVNFALDRPRLLAAGGAFAGKVTDQYLPEAMAGFRDEQIYPLTGPNLERARELAGWKPGDAMRRAELYTCSLAPPPGQPAHVCWARALEVKAQLAEIGLDVSITGFSGVIALDNATNWRGAPFDLALHGWTADFPDPYDILFLFDGSLIHDGGANLNRAYFSEPEYDRKLHEAQRLAGDERLRAFGDLDVELVQRWAPVAAFMNDNARTFFSDRVGCHVAQPVYGVSLGALCLRPEVTVGDVSVSEAAGEAQVTIALGSAEMQPLAVAYVTADGAAAAPGDYTPAAGAATFAAGERTKTITVPVRQDSLDEPDEAFSVELTGVTHGTIVDGRAVATITDDDAPPAVPPDTVPPRDPSVVSTSHKRGILSPDATVDVRWTGASDDASGVDGFSFTWDSSPATQPDAVKDAEEGAAETTSAQLAPGRWHYFHLRTRDNAGNWSRGVHLGPFAIAATGGKARTCVVPNVRGMALAAATAKIRRAGCRIGNVRRAPSRSVGKGRVRGQRPRPGTRLPVGGRVSLVVSTGRRR